MTHSTPLALSEERSAAGAPYHYSAHGLHIASELACPELKPFSPPSTSPDVLIRFGEVADHLVDCIQDDGFSQLKPGAYLLKLEGIARYFVRYGCEIVIQPAAGCPEDLIRLFLFARAFATLLHQRGLLILHASAIATRQGAVLFMGPSGVGKSTLMAGFLQAGHQVFTDDMCVIALNPNQRPYVWPSFAQMRLWNDSIDLLGYDQRTMERVWNREDKYTYHFQDQLAAEPDVLHAIYLLTPADGDAVVIKHLSSTEQFMALLDNIFRAEYLAGLGVFEHVFRQAAVLLQYCQVNRLMRPRALLSIEQLIHCVASDIQLSDENA